MFANLFNRPTVGNNMVNTNMVNNTNMGMTTYSIAATEFDDVVDEGKLINTTLDATALPNPNVNGSPNPNPYVTEGYATEGDTTTGKTGTAVAMPTTSTSIVSGEKKSVGSNSKD